MNRKQKQEFLKKFNHLWSNAIGTPNYKKEDWVELEKEIKGIFQESKTTKAKKK